MKTGTRARYGSARGVLFFALCLLTDGFTLTPNPPEAQPVSGQSEQPSLTVLLEYREASTELYSFGLRFDQQPGTFAREPSLSPRGVRRGTFQLDALRGLAFIWDQTQGELYLDLNRNGDLADDTDGKFKCSPATGADYFQRFENIRLETPVDDLQQRLMFNLHLYNFSGLDGAIALRSYWSGKVTLPQGEFELGIVPQLLGKETLRDGEMLLRPWSEANRPFRVGDGTLVTFRCGPSLYFQGQAWDLERKLRNETPLRTEITLTPREVVRGDLHFSGRHIHRLILTEGPFAAVIDSPSGKVAIPVGTYQNSSLYLKQGDVEARLNLSPPELGFVRTPVKVEAATTAEFAVGGPLTNTVLVQKRGESLVLTYQLRGASGETYGPLRRDAGEAPQFAIYRGEQLLASGSFEFG